MKNNIHISKLQKKKCIKGKKKIGIKTLIRDNYKQNIQNMSIDK